MVKASVIELAKKVRLVLTDNDGCLTDSGVYYGPDGELMKRFSIRDGMGVELLREHGAIATGIVTGEHSPSVIRRAEKLRISELHLGVKDKKATVLAIAARLDTAPDQIAYLGDDVNDFGAFEVVGFKVCPADAVDSVKARADLVLEKNGGQGAFRELADFILLAQGKGF